MKQYLIPNEGRFYKANMHTHTTVSDGRLTPEEIKEIYKEQGYSVVAFTDHDIMIDHSELNDESFLAITSYEVETNRPGRQGASPRENPTYHLNFYARRPDETFYPCPNPGYTWGNARALVQDYYKGDYKRVYSVEGQNEMITEARAHGFLVNYNHPDWSIQHYPDYAGLEGLTGVEVFNGTCYQEGFSLDASDHVLDDLLCLGKRVYPIAADDTHFRHNCCQGWIDIKADALNYDSIFSAYEKGDFYASWGPAIRELWLEDGVLHVECSGVKTVFLCTERRMPGRVNAAEGEVVTHASFDLKAHYADVHSGSFDGRSFVRLVLVDHDGNKAMTRGYFADELSMAARGLAE